MTELHWLSASELAEAFRARRLSPVAVMEALQARIAALDGTLNAFLHVDRAGAMDAARRAEAAISAGAALGPLHGVPFAVKDVIDVAGMPTTCHSQLMPRTPVPRDAAAVARLRAAGAIPLGKLATHEFALGGPCFDLPFPPARNPWNRDHHPGGSSSGAGAAVAAGMVPLAIGTDTAGSIRNPAGGCGIVGLKPTYGAVPRDGVFPLAPSLDHVGPLTRTVADAALVFAVMADAAGPVDGAPLPLAGMRIGVIRHFHRGDLEAAPEVADALDRAEAMFAAQGAVLTPVTLPPLSLFTTANRIILQAEGWSIHAEWLRERPEDYAASTRQRLLPGAFLTAEDLLRAQRLRRELIMAMEAALAGVDVLLAANSLDPNCRIDDPEALKRTYPRQVRAPFNLTGHPAVALMAGLSREGLPISLQLAGRYHGEARLLGIAAAYERAAGFAGLHPPV